LLEGIPFDNTSPFDSEFVLQVVSRSIPSEGRWNTMQGYSWKEVCFKLISWDTSSMIPLLDTLLNAMGNIYCLSYDTNILAVANKLVQSNPIRAWETVKTQFEQILPKWRSDLLHWLKGGIGGFGEKEPYAIISAIPVKEILDWIEEDPTIRAPIIAHATPGTLSKEHGGDLTRELLIRYKMIDGVLSGIDGNFHSGGWSGPRSNYLKRKREKFRNWLAAGFEQEITQWLEEEIEYLDKSITREEIAEERSMFS
ncbi:MAG TPA: hypothetical protein VHO70_04060, partial [Chitinispirillaceae bacterium]|nr:hypothetical protein [Chitinispirillaceae bacterium]